MSVLGPKRTSCECIWAVSDTAPSLEKLIPPSLCRRCCAMAWAHWILLLYNGKYSICFNGNCLVETLGLVVRLVGFWFFWEGVVLFCFVATYALFLPMNFFSVDAVERDTYNHAILPAISVLFCCYAGLRDIVLWQTSGNRDNSVTAGHVKMLLGSFCYLLLNCFEAVLYKRAFLESCMVPWTKVANCKAVWKTKW